MIYKADEKLRKKLFPIFNGMNDTIILSCLQGHMGTAWVDNLENPKTAQIIVGDFVFYAGDTTTNEVEELLCNLPKESYVVVSNGEWEKCIETIHKGHIEKFQRYAFKKDSKYLDCNYIKTFLNKLPKEYELKKVDLELVKSFNELSEDFTRQFKSIEDYINRGIGYCILHDGKVVCGASSYSIYDDGIEIEIDTHPDYRRKGLATITAAALIVHCLNKGIYPSWDAANLKSVGLAQKLGYMLEGPYDTYYIKNDLKHD